MAKKEVKTLSEWFGDATAGDGRRFRFPNMDGWFEPVFKANDGWSCKNQDGDQSLETDWVRCEIYTETETRWLWADKSGRMSHKFSATAPYDEFNVKLEWSATEFEVV